MAMSNNIPMEAINNSLDMLPRKMKSDEAIVMLIAIGLQESRFKHRKQIGGPANGFWQFESGGGVRGVMTHQSSRCQARLLCSNLEVEWSQSIIYNSLIDNDELAAGFARLLLWTDANPLPKIGDSSASWDYYIRNWRPGKPHPETWAELYQQAVEFVWVVDL